MFPSFLLHIMQKCITRARQNNGKEAVGKPENGLKDDKILENTERFHSLVHKRVFLRFRPYIFQLSQSPSSNTDSSLPFFNLNILKSFRSNQTFLWSAPSLNLAKYRTHCIHNANFTNCQLLISKRSSVRIYGLLQFWRKLRVSFSSKTLESNFH